MTVESTTSRVQYSTNGTTGPWSVPYYFLADADLRVVYTDSAGVETTLALTVDYTVTGAGVQSGGSVTTVAAYVAGGTVTIVRDLDALQPTDYVNTDSFPAETLERNLDRLTMLSQQALEVTNRAITVPVSDTAGSALGPAATRLDRLLAFDAVTGAAEVSAFTASQVAAAIAAAQTSGVPGSHILGMEVVTVTAGDTLVNLPSLRYSVGVNSLLAIADGVVLTAAGGDFTETSTSSVTLAQPFAVDADLTFLVGQLVTSGIESDQVSTQAAGTGAIARSLTEVNDDEVNVMNYMTPTQRADVRAGTGSVDVTAALAAAHAALPAAGGLIVMPAGHYRISSAWTVTKSNTRIKGAGRKATKITQVTTTAKVFDLAANHVNIESIEIAYSGTPASGAVAIHTIGSFSHFRDFLISSCYTGVDINGGVANKITEFDIRDYVHIGIFCRDMNDVFIDNFVMDAGNSTRGVLGGIRLDGKAEAVMVSNGDIINGVYSLTTAATTYGVNTRPAYNRFSSVYFDSAVNGALVERSVETDFIGCWFSNRPENGAVVKESDGIRFIGGGAINCAKHGVLVQADAVRVVFNGFASRGNSTGTSNTYNGIHFAAGCTDFSVQGCTLGGAVGFGTQKHGVEVATGASDRYIIADNLVSGNGTGGVSDNGSGSDKRVANNY